MSAESITTQKILDGLFSIAHIIAEHSGQQEMLNEILTILDRDLGMERGTVMLLSPDGAELIVGEVSATSTGVDTNARYRCGEGITGRVLSTGIAAIIPDISLESEFLDLIHHRRDAGLTRTGFICVPICIRTDVIGTLSIDIPCPWEHNLTIMARVLDIITVMIANDVDRRRCALAEHRNLEVLTLQLRDAIGEDFRPRDMIGLSKEMRSVYLKIDQVSHVDTTVLIRGESGTGKELVASAIHFSSPRAQKPFIKINCGALNENLLESELFGHEKGAFTGALAMRIGRIEEAAGGTLFLDEIGDISPALQVKLLRVLQEREFERVGSSQTRKIDVRILTATNRDLEQAVANGAFRQDLYYRINVFAIFLPPLRERRDDILSLANHFVEKYSGKMEKAVRRISTPAINAMMLYHWPGNVRELENCIEHAVIVSTNNVIHAYDLPPTLQCPSAEEIANAGLLPMRIRQIENDMIVDALKLTKGNIEAAARQLGITSRMVRYKIKKLTIDYERFFS
jgi:Nif-specific regulatory protein